MRRDHDLLIAVLEHQLSGEAIVLARDQDNRRVRVVLPNVLDDPG